MAKEFDVCHVPGVIRNEYGTPLLNGLFEKAQRLASHDLLCYVNSDIILMNDFVQAVEKVSQRRKQFLMIGECWNLDLPDLLALDQLDWEERLRSLVRQKGKPRGPDGIDYFVFPRGFYAHLPPFAIGRAGFDNWLIWKARSLKAAVVDATQAVMAVHQNHDYSHVPGGRTWSYRGEEASRNLELAGGLRHLYVTFDATHRLDTNGLKRNFGGYLRLKVRWKNTMGPFGWWILELTCPIRHPLGLRMATLKRLKAYLFR